MPLNDKSWKEGIPLEVYWGLKFIYVSNTNEPNYSERIELILTINCVFHCYLVVYTQFDLY